MKHVLSLAAGVFAVLSACGGDDVVGTGLLILQGEGESAIVCGFVDEEDFCVDPIFDLGDYLVLGLAPDITFRDASGNRISNDVVEVVRRSGQGNFDARLAD